VAPFTQKGTTAGAWAERLMGSKLVSFFLVIQKGSFCVFFFMENLVLQQVKATTIVFRELIMTYLECSDLY
jgi:hypothetical protein